MYQCYNKVSNLTLQTSGKLLSPVVQRVDNTNNRLKNRYAVDISVDKTNYALHWILINLVDSIILTTL